MTVFTMFLKREVHTAHVPNDIILIVSTMFLTLFLLPCLRYGKAKIADQGKFETSESQTRERIGRQNSAKDSTAFGRQNSI